MKTAPLYTALLLATAMLLPFARCLAQTDPQNKQGSIFQDKHLRQLLQPLEKIRTVVEQCGLLRPPVGFDAVWEEFDMDAPREITWQKQRPTVLSIGLTQYYVDRTGAVKPGTEAYADLDIEVNSFRRLYDDTYSRDLSAAGYPCPIFFFRYHKKTADSTNDYVEYTLLDGKAPVRIVTNGKPLFVPLTRQQYLNFQIQSNKRNADDAHKNYVHDSLTIANIPGKQDVLNGGKDLENTWRTRMNNHRQQLTAMGDEERRQPAFVVWGGAGNTDNMEELTTADDSKAQELWTPNPEYFNKNLPSSAVQMIVVNPEWASIAPSFIKGKVMDIFQQIDYKSLKALIQN